MKVMLAPHNETKELTLLSREEAFALGRKLYFTGEPCRRGHVGPRYVSSRGCVACAKEEDIRWRAENPESAKERSARWRARHPEKVGEWGRKHPERRREISKRFYAEHPEKKDEYYLSHKDEISAYHTAWYSLNKGHVRARAREYYKNNKDRFRAYVMNRHAKVAGAVGTHCGADIESLLGKQRFLCAACGKDISARYHVDHIIPLSRGGGNGVENLQVLCPECNLSKGTKTMDEWSSINHGRMGARNVHL